MALHYNSVAMATLQEEIKAAEVRVRKAYDALMAYVERPESQPSEVKLHCRLADDLALANNQYVVLVAKQKPSSS
jgi:hypothetical protein